VRFDDDNGHHTRTISELIDWALDTTAKERPDAIRVLRSNGILIREDGLCISNSHKELKRIYSDTPWNGGKWKDQFARVQGAEKLKNPVHFGTGSKHRSVLIPVGAL